MKKWFILFLISFLSVWVNAQEQILYRAGQSKTDLSTPIKRWELSGAFGRAWGSLQDGAGEEMFSHQTLWSGRGLFFVRSGLALGVEGVWLPQRKDPSGMIHYRARRYGLIGKWVLAPNTQPSPYVFIGYGKTKQRFTYAFNWQETQTSSYGLIGLGLEAKLVGALFVAGEVSAVHPTHRSAGSFLKHKHSWEFQASARLGVRF